MLKPYLVLGSHVIRVHVDIKGQPRKQCECPLLDKDGIGLIIAPQDWEIQREFETNSEALLIAVQQIDPLIHTLRMSAQS